MASNQSKNAGGGNTPRPAASGQGGSGQSAKDKSRAQSRPVSGKAPATKGGNAQGKASSGSGGKGGSGGRGGNTPRPRPGGRPAPAPRRRGLSGAALAWGAVGLVVVIVVVLVVVKVTSGSSTSSGSGSYTPVTPAPASVVRDVTTIPESVYNKVGVSDANVVKPIVLTGKAPLTIDGTSPAMLYYGAEYCPYCAAERWAMTAALSRFGTWSGLKITASSHTDVDAETHTFSYYGSTYTSQYLTFKSIEAYSNVPSDGYYTTLQTPTKAEQKIIEAGQSSIPGATAGSISFPFVNINNVAIISGASYDPGILSGQTWSEIAGGLSDPTNPATQAIVTTANYMTAAICASTKDAPSSVCDSPGVEAAAKALKLS
jgi:hypothetical protein